MQSKKRMVAVAANDLVTVAATGLLALAIAGGGLKAWAVKGARGEVEDGKEVKVTLPKAQLEASLKTALNARPGKVLEVTAVRKKGKTNCNVEVVAEDGKTYAVVVDVAANKATSVESEDDEDAKDGK